MDSSALARASSDLEIAIRALEKSSDSLRWWFLFWTVVVILGLVIEYVPNVIELIKELRDKRSFVVREFIKKRALKWSLLFEVIGGTLITVGLVGELWTDFDSSAVESDLRTARGRQTELLRNAAGQAMERAGNAEERASNAEKATEAEKIERLKLEALVAPRSLSVDQQRLITAALRRFSGRQATLSSYGLDGEGAALGAQLISILRSAGIVVTDRRASFIATGGFESGIQIRGPNTEREFISGLAEALSSIGKLQQVFINAPSFRAGAIMGGAAITGGAASIGGGGGVVVPDIPSTGPVSIMIGVKPLPAIAK